MRRHMVTERDSPDRPAAIRSPGFVGRDREMAALHGALSSDPAVVVVEGEAGVGKTRLVREFLAAAGSDGVGMLVTACPPFRQPHTLGPVVDAVREAAGDLRELGLSGLAGVLRPVFPEWAPVLPPAPEPLEDASAARHRVFRALAEVLDRLGTRMLVTEDAHWADEATLELLLFVASARPRRISLLVTYRPEEVPAESLLLRLTRLASGTDGLRLSLGLLDVAQTRNLISSMLDGGEVSEQFATFVHERTEGLPLAVEESVRLMGDRADLAFRHGSWARRHLPDIEVPPTVRDAVLERAARLSAHAVAILRAAAVLGEPTDEWVLTSVSELADDEARTGLAEALGCGLVIETWTPGGQCLVFRHVLAARAIYDAIPMPLRRDMHQRAGHALQVVAPMAPARLAHHFREAGDSGPWSQYGEQAADLALTTGDHHTAATTLHDLVVNAGLPPGEVVRLAHKVPMMALPGYTSVAGITQSLRSALNSGGLSASQQAEARWRLGQILIEAGDCSAVATEVERAVPGLAHRPVEAAHAMIALGWPLHGLWPAARHRRWLDRAAGAASDPAVSASDRRRILGDRTTALLMMGDEEGWSYIAELPQDAADRQEAMSLAIDWMNAGEEAMHWGRYVQARQALTVALRLASKYQYPRVRDYAQVWQAHLDWFTGAWEGLPGRAKALLTDLTDAAPPVSMEAMLTVALLDAAAGATGPAEEKLQLVLDEQIRRGIATYIHEPAAALARLRLASGQIDDALVLTEDPLNVIAAKGIWIWATDVAPARVQALVAADRVYEAGELVRAYAAGLWGRDAPAPQAALLACQAILATARDDHRRAADLFAQASHAWAVLPRPYDALLCREQQACCDLAAGEREASLTLLSEVLRGLSALGATADADRVAHILRKHGVAARRTWRRGRLGYGDQLSPRELEVVRLVAEGQTNQSIAHALSRSTKTVETQLKSAMRKLGVKSRTALAVRMTEAALAANDSSDREGGPA